MSIFKYRHFKYDFITWVVRWYCKYGISYRELEEVPNERGVNVDHDNLSMGSTICSTHSREGQMVLASARQGGLEG
ncbi:IS6 family transposase (plasmid) [Vibrio mediterranei]|uniref:IS6 family transposase n=1 Tax=Vibrio mediterranei TaxID=689 RepID=A0A3G4VLM1_9VIBR|nr:IS6 family transposase [Vibrio mediterranei]